MYLKYFGLRSLPFESVSNATLYLDLPEQREAFNTVLFGLRSGEGFIKVVGEVGTGKTALCQHLLERIDENYIAVYLPNPALSPHDLLLAMSDELGVPAPPDCGMHHLTKNIRETLLDIKRNGGRVAVFVDEAQTMPGATLEELRLLSNLESNLGRLIQVVLFGQPELDEKLSHYSLRQLQQRISFSAQLAPLDRDTCCDYIRRRLNASGGARSESLFTPAAMERIHRSSGGIPRLINLLCHKSMIAAFSDRDFQVGRRHVARAVGDTEGIQRWRTHPLFKSIIARRAGRSNPAWRSLTP